MKTKIILLALVATFAISMFSSCCITDEDYKPCEDKKTDRKIECNDSLSKN